MSEEHWRVKDIKLHTDALQAEMDGLEAKVAELKSEMEHFEPYAPIPFLGANPDPLADDEAFAVIQEEYEASMAIAKANDERYKRNIALARRFIEQGVVLGLPAKVHDQKSRKVIKPLVDAPWVKGVLASVPGPGMCKASALENAWRNYMRGRELALQKKRDEEIALRAQERQEQVRVTCVTLALELGLDPHITASELFDHLCARNKYLDLAVAMERTRNDWSDGYWRVEEALERFGEETDTDRMIRADVSGCMDTSWGVDGRGFRDTEWNYARLYEMVPTKIAGAFNTLREVAGILEGAWV